MSAEVYMACEPCKAAFHVGYIVTFHSTFVWDADLPARLPKLQDWITKHTYCGEGLRYPGLAWEPVVDEDTWTIEERS